MLGILKYLGMVLLFTVGVGQTLLYKRVKRKWGSLPVVAAEIIESQLIDHTDIEGNRVYESRIRFKYQFRGKEYESSTPLLKSPQLFPDNNIEHELLTKYQVGSVINARVLPNSPKLAYLEVSPFSKVSAIGVPVLVALYAFFVFGYGWFMVNIINYGAGSSV